MQRITKRSAGFLRGAVLPFLAAAGMAMCGAWGEPVMKGKMLDAAQFGMAANDGKDDTLALQAALDACRIHRAAGLRLEKGRYDFAAGTGVHGHNGDVAAFLHETDGFVLEGNGAELFYSGLVKPFVFHRCKNVTIQNLSIDWERPPFSNGIVESVGERQFDVRISSAFPMPEALPVGAFMDYDADTGKPVKFGLDVYHSVERTELVGPQLLRLHTTWDTPVKEGMFLCLRHQVYAYDAFAFIECEDVAARDITVYTTPGMGLVVSHCHNVTLDNFSTRIRPNTERLISVTADGSHYGGCTGTITATDCVFEGMGDDAFNLKSGLYLEVLEILDPHTVRAKHNLDMTDLPAPGNRMEITPQDTLLPQGVVVIAQAEREEDGITHRLTFAEPMPGTLDVGDLLGNITRTPKVRVSNCTVRGNRARGMLLQTRDVVVENCTFEGTTGGGIWVLTEVTHFFESVPARDVIIRNNTFRGCNHGAALGDAVVGVFAWLKDFATPPKPGIFKNIRIENNVIEDTTHSAIYLAGAQEVTVRGNTVRMACTDPKRPGGDAVFRVLNSRDVVFEDNSAPLDAQGPGCTALLALEPGLEPGAVRHDIPEAHVRSGAVQQ